MWLVTLKGGDGDGRVEEGRERGEEASCCGQLLYVVAIEGCVCGGGGGGWVVGLWSERGGGGGGG